MPTWQNEERKFGAKIEIFLLFAYLGGPTAPQTTFTRTHPSLLGSCDDALGGFIRRDDASSARGHTKS